MAKRLKPIDCPRIVERHPALGQTEVALSRYAGDRDMFVVELITAKADGEYDRDLISGIFPTSRKRNLQKQLSAFHAGVVVAQRALGMSVDRHFA